jgi:hypothetical protein
MALHDEDVRAANAFTEPWAHLSVGKFDQVVFAKFDP